MKNLLLLPLIISSLVVHSMDYRAYNQLLNRANESYLREQYNEALTMYDSALQIAPAIRAKELEKAMIAAIKLNKEKTAMKYAFRLSKLGVGDAYFAMEQYALLKKSKDWQRLSRDAAQNKAALTTKNTVILQQLYNMKIAADAAEQDYVASARSYADQMTFRSQKDSLANVLLQLFDKEGYLSEYKIGVTLAGNEISDPIFTKVILIAQKLPAPPDLFELVENPIYKNLLARYYRQGLIDSSYLAHLGYGAMANNL